MSSVSTEKSSMEIDLRVLISDFLRGAKRLLWLGILLVLLASAALCGRTYLSYTPSYQAKASFTVYVSNPLQAGIRTYNAATAQQMAKTFPYILTSGALNDMVMQELGISAMPAVSANVLENTNIFTLTVTSSDPQLAYDVLNAVITYYPDVAEFVVGPTTMNLLDESGVPSVPVNSRNYKSAIKKGVVGGLVVWVAVVLLFSFMRSTVHNETELKQLVNLRCLGMLPMTKAAHRRGRNSRGTLLIDDNDKYGFSESIRLLRIRTEKEMRAYNRKVLLVSSAIPGEGKTTVASNLALALAQKGKRTLLIDCDLRNPSVASIWEQEGVPGFAAFLTGKVKAGEIIRRQQEKNLYVVYGGPPASDASELLSKPEAQYFIQAVRNVFDYVILDTPPCSMLPDAAEMAELADCALYVIRQDYAPKGRVLEGAQMLSDGNLPLMGCVMNCVKRGALGGSYSYYGYGYGHGEYYRNDQSEDGAEHEHQNAQEDHVQESGKE